VTPTTTEIGRNYEQLASRYYSETLGATVLAHNFRMRSAEVDLIVEHEGQLVFVEVKYRSDRKISSGLESVDFRKRKRIERAAEFYLARMSDVSRSQFRGVRFDVLVTEGERVYHLEDAWRAS
jgi:putative endonuclease